MPGAGRTHGPPAKWKAGGSHHRQGRNNRHSLRDGFNGCFVLSLEYRYRMHTSLLQRLAKADSLVGVGLAGDGVMSMEVGLGRFGDRRLEKGGSHCMRPWFDGLARAFGALEGAERRRSASGVFYATKR
jgi:hypothetical protein